MIVTEFFQFTNLGSLLKLQNFQCVALSLFIFIFISCSLLDNIRFL